MFVLRRTSFISSRSIAGNFARSTMSTSTHSTDYDRSTKLLTLEPRGKVDSCVILSHGLGDTGMGWADGAAFLGKHLQSTRFLLPTAPERPVTLNGGIKMTAWYDIIGLSSRNDEPCEGLVDSSSYITSLVKEQIKLDIPSNKICLAGFSQGAALSLYSGLQSEIQLGAIVAMSGYIPLINGKITGIKNQEILKSTPIKIYHGTDDNVVPFKFGKKSYDYLQDTMKLDNVEFYSISGLEHGANMEELTDVAKFIGNALK